MYTIVTYNGKYCLAFILTNRLHIDIDKKALDFSQFNKDINDFNVALIPLVYDPHTIVCSSNLKELSHLTNLLNLKEVLDHTHMMHSIKYHHIQMYKYKYDNYYYLLFKVAFEHPNLILHKEHLIDEKLECYLHKELFHDGNGPWLYGKIYSLILQACSINRKKLKLPYQIINRQFFFEPIEINAENEDKLNHDIDYLNSHFSLVALT